MPAISLLPHEQDFISSLLPHEQDLISSIQCVCDDIIRQLQLLRGHVYHGAGTIQMLFCCRQVLVWATAEQRIFTEQLRMQSCIRATKLASLVHQQHA